jgi:hypothetical protein
MLELRLFFPFGYAVSIIALARSIFWTLPRDALMARFLHNKLLIDQKLTQRRFFE